MNWATFWINSCGCKSPLANKMCRIRPHASQSCSEHQREPLHRWPDEVTNVSGQGEKRMSPSTGEKPAKRVRFSRDEGDLDESGDHIINKDDSLSQKVNNPHLAERLANA